MTTWQLNLRGALIATGVGAVITIAAGITPARADFMSGLQNWLGNEPAQAGTQASSEGRRGIWFGRRQEQVEPQGPDPFKEQWVRNPQLGFPTLARENIAQTERAIQIYEQIVARGGWPRVPELALRPGSRGDEIVTLHQRLEISGDLYGQSVPNEYDETLVQAVRRFQESHGLPPTGVIDRPTVDALNVPAEVRLQQLKASLAALKKAVPQTKNRYVIVNIPAAQSEAVENGQVVGRYTAVVGKADLATPTLESTIQRVSFNPYWNVPKSIVRNDLVPKARELTASGIDFFDTYRMQAIDGSGRILRSDQIDWYGDAVYGYRFRQLPWEENALGYIKLDFPNKYAVYMHDTPEKALFGQELRYESHGCVRIHNVDQLAAWLLRDVPGWDLPRIQELKHTGEQEVVSLRSKVQVMFVYIDGWATPDGVIHFRPDIYNKNSGATTASAY
ncbi:murein L,D-transpeptidase [Methyloligella halotolerans]|uniref:Murein L,D-transpeptidase n=1 Tax=Methyloligella halotolerans TaxID=1177755 RepID=A0A1E2S2H1_9HYPH|nr:L,D-transpeptidase family protein [Methyloligella halotolerans]ODA68580.1 murein L,D-transpeptidase [Methyloligella halotolerans]